MSYDEDYQISPHLTGDPRNLVIVDNRPTRAIEKLVSNACDHLLADVKCILSEAGYTLNRKVLALSFSSSVTVEIIDLYRARVRSML